MSDCSPFATFIFTRMGPSRFVWFLSPFTDLASCWLLNFRFERHWNEELARHGKEKASVARAIIRMIRARLIFAIFLTFAFSAFAILGPVCIHKLTTLLLFFLLHIFFIHSHLLHETNFYLVKY